MNYLEYFQPGGMLEVKGPNGPNGSKIQYTNLRNLYEYMKLFTQKIKRYNEIDNKLKEITPKNNQTSPNNYKWNLFDYIKHPTNPEYQPLFS